MRDNREIKYAPRRSSVSTIFATCSLIDCNNLASPDLNPIGKTFQRRKAGTKETIIKYRISSETFQKFAREVQSTLYQTRKDINY